MPRTARIIIPGKVHHVTQRGNNRQNVFFGQEDFSAYCYWINKYAKEHKLDVLAYCLMNNHVHLLLVPSDREGMALALRAVHMRYARYMHHKKRTSGHVWQGRYFSCVVGEDHLFYAIRYVEQNPVRAGMVREPWAYSWSSARGHLGLPLEKYIKIKGSTVADKKYWKEYLSNADPQIDARLRRKTYKGKAFAGGGFISHWEAKLKCVLRELKPGRKPKEEQQ